MRRWDSLVAHYIEEYFARGINPATIGNVRSELDRLGTYLKRHAVSGWSSVLQYKNCMPVIVALMVPLDVPCAANAI